MRLIFIILMALSTAAMAGIYAPGVTGGSNAAVATNAPDGNPLATVRSAAQAQTYSLPSSLTYPPNFMSSPPSMPFTNGTWGLVVLHTNGTTTTYLTTTNTDVARGGLFDPAVEAATDGDVFFCSPGSFVLDAPACYFTGLLSDFNNGISVVGSGKSATFLTLSPAYLGGRSSFRDLTLTNPIAGSIDRIPTYTPASSNNPSWFINVRFVATDIDLFIIATDLSGSWAFKNCDFYGPYDVFASSGGMGANTTIYSYNCNYHLTGGANIFQTGVKYTDMAAQAFVYNDTIADSGGTNGNYGTYLRYNGTAHLFNVSVSTSGAGTNMDFFAESGSTNIINNDCSYDPTKVRGGKAFVNFNTPVTAYEGTFTGSGSGLTNLVYAALPSAPTFAQIGSVTNVTFLWNSNPPTSKAPTNWLQYYAAPSTLTTIQHFP